jgi:hypothetical protein
MSFEIVVTSAPSGLKPGAKGYCTVGATKGIAPQVLTTLESLSGYRWLYSASDPRNPVIYSHLLLKSGESILSRIGDAGLDYSNRENKLAHHLVLTAGERPAEGPTRTMAHSTTLIQKWEGDPRYLPQRKILADSEVSGPCRTWAQVTGDAGWAAVLAETVKGGTGREAFIVYRAGIDCLALIDEALSLLHSQERWTVTFSTFFTKNLLHHAQCQWRFIEKGQPEEKLIPPSSHAFRLDLTDICGTAPPDSPLAVQARTGVPPKKKVEKAVKPVPVELGFKEPKNEPNQSNASSRGIPAGIKQPATMGMSPILSPAEPEWPGTGAFADQFLEAPSPAPPDLFSKKKTKKRKSLLSKVLAIPVLIAFLMGCFLGLFMGVGTMLAITKATSQPTLAANTSDADKGVPKGPDQKPEDQLAHDEVDGGEINEPSPSEIVVIEPKNETSLEKLGDPEQTPSPADPTTLFRGPLDQPLSTDSSNVSRKESPKTIKLLVGKENIELPFTPKEYFYMQSGSSEKIPLQQQGSNLETPSDRPPGAAAVEVLRIADKNVSPRPDFKNRKDYVYCIANDTNDDPEKFLFYFAEDGFEIDAPKGFGLPGVPRAFNLPKFERGKIRLKAEHSDYWKPPSSDKKQQEEGEREQEHSLEIYSYLTETKASPIQQYKITGIVVLKLNHEKKQLVVTTEAKQEAVTNVDGLKPYEEVKKAITDNPIKLSFIFESAEIGDETFDVHWNDVPLILRFPEDTTGQNSGSK